MENPSNRGAVRRLSLIVLLGLAGLLLAAGPAAAQLPGRQYVVMPDRSIVYLGQPQPVFINPGFNVTPIVVPGNQFVRVSGPFSGVIINPGRGGYPGTGFIKPQTANERARASNFYGSPTYNPNPILTGPFQKWW